MKPRAVLLWIGLLTVVFVGSFVLAGLLKEKKPVSDKPGAAELRACLDGEDAMALCEDGETIWAGGKDGVFRIRKEDRTSEKMDMGTPVTYVRALCLDAEGRLWVGWQGGVLVWDGASASILDEKAGLPDDRVNAIVREGDAMVVGTWGGVATWRDGAWSVMTKADGLGDDMVNAILRSDDGSWWFGAYAVQDYGISVMRPDGAWQYFTVKNGLPNDNVSGLAQSPDGSVWAATGFYDRGGACRFVRGDDGSWRIAEIVTKDDGLAGEKARSVLVLEDGTVLIGSEYDGMAVRNGSGWTVWTAADGLSGDEVKTMIVDAAGGVWLGTRTGVTSAGKAFQ
jgi:ligand-binding sensor domain-containing protein